jgi:hypothetical protein
MCCSAQHRLWQLFFLLTAPGTAVRQTLRGVLANLLDITQLYCERRRYKYYKNKAS